MTEQQPDLAEAERRALEPHQEHWFDFSREPAMFHEDGTMTVCVSIAAAGRTGGCAGGRIERFPNFCADGAESKSSGEWSHNL
jgi:hypothetical protein